MDLKEWFQAYSGVYPYSAMDANSLKTLSYITRDVKSDELDANFVEQQIQKWASKTSVINGFCSKCQNLFDNWPTLVGRWECVVARSCSTFEIEGATRSKCRFCRFLLQSLKDSKLLDAFRKIESRLYQLNENAMPSLSIQKVSSNSRYILWLNFPGKVCTQFYQDIPSKTRFDSFSCPASADCYDNPLDVFNIARNWLSTCSESHQLCKSDDGGTLPTRLISIPNRSLRLVLTSQLPKRPQYATLSHSWGSYRFIKLTSEKLDSFMKGIPIEKLPNTFKDAVEIARRLGLHYLWIDSLCIIQDNDDDWQKESALMSSIYSGSTINIAAYSARDSSEGCLIKSPDFSSGLRVRITEGGRQRVQDFQSLHAHELSTWNTHLGTRAWALQEKILSPRTIHFGNRGVHWECKTKVASEYLPDGLTDLKVSPLVCRKGDVQNYWCQIVGLYSAANLSFPKDKLPALSGIARLVYNNTGDQYLAGLWRSGIEEQLCWYHCRSQLSVKSPHWRAPTWSWASIDGEVSWKLSDEMSPTTYYAHVLHASTEYCHDPFGQVTSGIIRLACSKMVAVSLARSKTRAIFVLHADNKKYKFPISLDSLDDCCEENNGPIYFLPLFDGMEIYDDILGVVLRATGATKGEYYRIGSFYLLFEEKEHFLQILKECGTATAEKQCAEIIENPEYPDERYVITLI